MKSEMTLMFCALLSLSGLPVAAAGAPAAAPPARKALSASGRVEPAGEERQLQFPVNGRIARMAAEEGREVKAGEVLAEIENGEEKAALEGAAAELARAQAALERLENGVRAEERSVADAEALVADRELKRVETGAAREEDRAAAWLALRRAEAARAERQAARLRKLREGETKAASQEELDAAEDALTVARAAEAEAQAGLALVSGPAREATVEASRAREKLAVENAALVKAKARVEDLAAARAAVESARAAKAAAEARIDKTLLRTPVDGTLLKVYRHVGELAGPNVGMPAVVVGDLSKLFVRAEVDENDITKVKLGQTVRAQATGLGAQRLGGKVVQVGRSMGRKRLFSEAPSERIDTKVLEVLIALDDKPSVPVGYRLDVYFLEDGER